MSELANQADANANSSRKADLLFAIGVALVVLVVILSMLLPSLIKSHSNLEADEVSAIKSFKDYIAAQNVYARNHRSRSGQPLFARALKTLGDESLIDSSFAHAEAVDIEAATGKAGYIYKTLTAQGPHAGGGRNSFIDADGEMTLGFALIAYPAAYDSTGKRTFMVGRDGMVYCKDLGRETARIVSEMTEYDPDNTWASIN